MLIAERFVVQQQALRVGNERKPIARDLFLVLRVEGVKKEVQLSLDLVKPDVEMTMTHLSKQLSLQPANVIVGTLDVKKFGSL